MQITRRIKLATAITAILMSTYGCDRIREAFSGDDDREEERSQGTSTHTEDEESDVEAIAPGIIIRSSDNADADVRLAIDASQPHQIEGDIIGRKPASEFGATCAGFIGDAPTFAFDIEGDEPVEMAISVLNSGGIDTTLVLDGPGGPYCDDDSGGATLPRLRAELPPGSYTVYIGSYSENQGAHYRASIGLGQPRFQVSDCNADSTIEISEGFDEQNVSGTLGSDTRLCRDGVALECDGHLSNTAGPCVVVTSRQVVRFSVTQADFDSVMVLQAEHAADSIYNDDGTAGLQSEIITVLEPGSYALHVGAYDPSTTGSWTVNAQRLDVTTDAKGTVQPTPATNCEVLTEGNVISLVGTTTPEIGCDFFFPDHSCVGAVPMTANHCIEVPNGMSVDIEITEANFDTILLMAGDSLVLSDDDGASGANLLSKISTPLPAGVYQLFIGSIDPKQAGPYRLQITPR